MWILPWVVMTYLWSTFLLFWTTHYTSLFNDNWQLAEMSIYIFLAYNAIIIGYWIFVHNRVNIQAVTPTKGFFSLAEHANAIVFLAGLHLICYAGVIFYAFNGFSFDAVYNGIFDSGAAYASKFDVYELQRDTNDTNIIMRLCTVTYFIYYAGFVCFIYCWNDLKIFTRVFFLLAIVMYILAFVSIGTHKGIADVIIFLSLGWGVRYAAKKIHANTEKAAKYKLFSKYWIILAFVLFSIYMANNQILRGQQFLNIDSYYAQAERSLWGSVFEPEIAVRINNVLSCPTQGYAGLTYALQQNFEFCYGYGLSPALYSYFEQYLNAPSMYENSYLFRSEINTGWPGKMYWSTIFPWLASDVTFIGGIFIMFLIGWLIAWAWYSTLYEQNIFGVITLSMLWEVILGIPVNNQLLMSRTGLWAVIGTIILFVFQYLKKRPVANVSNKYQK